MNEDLQRTVNVLLELYTAALPHDIQNVNAVAKVKVTEDALTKDIPYINIPQLTIIRLYNPAYGDDRVCECGHPYYRHFDTWEEMSAVGCKYCGCFDFKEHWCAKE